MLCDKLGALNSTTAKLHVKPNAVPKFRKARPVPFAIKEALGHELDRLEAEGILEKVKHSEWAAPVIAVPKKNGQLRVCGDSKVMVNLVLAIEMYPLPKPEDLMTNLAGDLQFFKLDLTQAYFQIVLDKESRKYVTINTHQGTVSVYEGTIWNSLCTRPIPMYNGYHFTRDPKYYLLFG